MLIIGLGSIAQKHIKALQTLIEDDLQIFALRSNKQAKVLDGVSNIYSLSEINEKPDFCIISNPTQLHTETIKDCVSLKVPLFIEKPLSAELTELEDVISEINKKNITTYIACNLRFHPVIKYIKESFLASNTEKINEVNVYCGSYLPDWRPGVDYRQVYSARKELGGGVHLDLIHELDYIYWFFGKPISVQSSVAKTSQLEMDSADYAHYVLEYKDFYVNVTLNYYRRDPKRTVEIVTAVSTYCGNLLNNQFTKLDAVEYSEEAIVQKMYNKQMQYFLNNMSGKTMNSIEEAFEVLKICLHNDIEG